jgi:ketosteroid isomerase-like protein
MTASLRLLPILALALTAPAVAQDVPAPAPPQARMTAAECEVWARELSFAQSVAEHDAVAFAEHLHPDAAFGVERAIPTRGRETIASQWAGLIDGKALALRWYPTRTTIGGVGNIAASSGPALYEDLTPGTKQRYSISRFHSVWHKGDDGVWRVLFDDGTSPQPVTEAEADAFKAARQAVCPRA